MKIPGIVKDTEIVRMVDEWDNDLDKILTKGWPKELDDVKAGLSIRSKRLPEEKYRGPKIKTSFVEEPAKIVARNQNPRPNLENENIILQLENWRCETCSFLKQRIKEHRPKKCFDKSDKKTRGRVRTMITDQCNRAKARRIAEEEAAKKEIENDNVKENGKEKADNMEELVEAFNKSVEDESPKEQFEVAKRLLFLNTLKVESREVVEKKLAGINFEDTNEVFEIRTAAVKDFEKPKFPKKSMDEDSSEGQD